MAPLDQESAEPPDIELNGTLLALYSYWRGKRGTRRMPSRANIDPIEISTFLPWVVIFELNQGRLRYRLAGSSTMELLGIDPTGRYLDEVVPERRYRIAARNYALALNEARPLVTRSRFVTPLGAIATITRLILPLSDDGVSPNMILAGVAVRRGKRVHQKLLGRTTIVDPNVVIQVLDQPAARL